MFVWFYLLYNFSIRLKAQHPTGFKGTILISTGLEQTKEELYEVRPIHLPRHSNTSLRLQILNLKHLNRDQLSEKNEPKPLSYQPLLKSFKPKVSPSQKSRIPTGEKSSSRPRQHWDR